MDARILTISPSVRSGIRLPRLHPRESIRRDEPPQGDPRQLSGLPSRPLNVSQVGWVFGIGASSVELLLTRAVVRNRVL